MNLKESTRQTLVRVGKVVMLFGVLSYMTSCIMDMEAGLDVEETVPASGGTIGPVQVDDTNAVLHLSVEQSIAQGRGSFARWSFITVALLDQDKEYLTGFGGELWHEAGYNGDYWREQKRSFETKMTIPEAGKYYFRLTPESDVGGNELSQIAVDIEQDLGSALPHHVAGILGLLLGGILWVMGRVRTMEELEGGPEVRI